MPRPVLSILATASLLAGCASFSGRTAGVAGTEPGIPLLRHLVADVDSVRFAWEPRWGPSTAIYIDYRLLAPGTTNDGARSEFVTIPAVVAHARTAAILSAGKDTAAMHRWNLCPFALTPDASRDGCPDRDIVVYAFSDTLTLHPGQLGAGERPELIVLVQRTYMNRSGKHVAQGQYTVAWLDSRWKTIRRQIIGTIE